MADSNHKYEIFIKSSTRQIGSGAMQSIWSWRKRDAAGFIVVRGTDHGSMADCLWAAREYRGKFDDAPIGIELRVMDGPDAVGVVHLVGADVGAGAPNHAAGSNQNRINDVALYEREARYIRREEDARNRAAHTEDSALRNEFLQSARVYADLIGSIRRERGTSH